MTIEVGIRRGTFILDSIHNECEKSGESINFILCVINQTNTLSHRMGMRAKMLPMMRVGFVMRIAKTENISNDQILAEESGFYVCLLIGNFPHHLPYLSSSLCLNSSGKLSFTTEYAPPSLIPSGVFSFFNKILSNFFFNIFTQQSIIIIEQSEQFR